MKGSALAASLFVRCRKVAEWTGTGECGWQKKARISGTVPWCSGLAYVPVKDEIAGSNPVGTAVIDRLTQSLIAVAVAH